MGAAIWVSHIGTCSDGPLPLTVLSITPIRHGGGHACCGLGRGWFRQPQHPTSERENQTLYLPQGMEPHTLDHTVLAVLPLDLEPMICLDLGQIPASSSAQLRLLPPLMPHPRGEGSVSLHSTPMGYSHTAGPQMGVSMS